MPSSLGHPADQEFFFASDGTAIYFANNTSSWVGLSAQSNAFKQQINDWSVATYPFETHYSTSRLAIFFPQPRLITNWSGAWNANMLITTIETSTDATAPDLGTWTVRYPSDASTSYWRYNTDIRRMRQPWSVGWNDVVAVRFTITGNDHGILHDLHFWGQYVRPGLVFWDATTDIEMPGSNLDFGDIPQASTNTTTFRIKNNHSTQTANNVTISCETTGTGGIVSNVTFSDGGAFVSGLVIASIAPGSISPVITARRTVAAGATLSVGATSISAIAGSWV